MTLTTVPLSKLLAPQGNPRRLLDKTQIAGLAQSISINGMLQNLVVRPEGDDTYRVISGKRRYLALHLLKDTRAIDSSYEVPVRIKLDLGDKEALQIATVENVQREQLHPLDEGEAFAKLLQSGGSLDVVIEQTGLSVGVVRRRLALASLSPEVKKAFRAGEFNRSIAEALSLAAREQQRGRHPFAQQLGFQRGAEGGTAVASSSRGVTRIDGSIVASVWPLALYPVIASPCEAIHLRSSF